VPGCSTLCHPAPGAPGKFADVQISDVQMKKNALPFSNLQISTFSN
jgi:hypothetical protein